MGTISDSIQVDVDRTTAYNQWTQFEEFPMFMEGVEEVRQLTDTTLHWVTKVGPVVREYDAEITEQQPDELIAWHSTSGPDNAGRVTFSDVGDGSTEINLELTIDPEGLVEKVGDMTGAIDARAAGDLRRFKEFIESRGGQETGEWRGTVEDGNVESGSGSGSGSGMAGSGSGMAGSDSATFGSGPDTFGEEGRVAGGTGQQRSGGLREDRSGYGLE